MNKPLRIIATILLGIAAVICMYRCFNEVKYFIYILKDGMSYLGIGYLIYQFIIVLFEPFLIVACVLMIVGAWAKREKICAVTYLLVAIAEGVSFSAYLLLLSRDFYTIGIFWLFETTLYNISFILTFIFLRLMIKKQKKVFSILYWIFFGQVAFNTVFGVVFSGIEYGFYKGLLVNLLLEILYLSILLAPYFINLSFAKERIHNNAVAALNELELRYQNQQIPEAEYTVRKAEILKSLQA